MKFELSEVGRKVQEKYHVVGVIVCAELFTVLLFGVLIRLYRPPIYFVLYMWLSWLIIVVGHFFFRFFEGGKQNG